MGLSRYFASQCQLILIAGLFPLNSRRWLTADIINYAGYATNLIDDTVRNTA